MRILVPLDTSPEAEAVLGAVMPIVRAFSCEVVLLHVLEQPGPVESGRAYLEKAAGALRSKGIASSSCLRQGDVAEQIVSFAHIAEAGLIAMATHGRRGLRRLMAGSVTESVLRRAEVPLIVCRPGTGLREWKRILVGLDGSARAEKILSDIAWIARGVRASVDVLEATLPVVVPGAAGEFPAVFDAEDPLPYLRTICDRLAAQGVPATPTARVGRPATQIVQQAEETAAGLIAITTHGRSGLSRALAGSVAEEVLRTAPCPVLVRRLAMEEMPCSKT